ncbi:MAG: hypothetical protein A2W90_14595 [Bacteroidetes bacterium GWF2_42_66]|nr:MAG: hypothetical protein A2W92_15990 [Bacteroidetes bacterium GWA2_42_15]OFX99076.1 MAG: hypothetical protein A2W89_06665 [Bacteroidetes bacterium GWE2_42_39]OFY46755.1 MAG: hypothetical protein A2W90_14595 [Bacteroidetes bacterium GWF2_42_66]HAZ00702.1 hypothetical protein [Marinilabiliales bacterium]HBL73838.1 hypothetical protein [Prolixibacteraceae bacterium]
MNKQIFTAVCDRLKSQVTELRWIDWDDGQADIINERPQVAFPAALVDIVYPSCEDETDTDQLVKANIIIRLFFEPRGATNTKSPVRATALASFDVIDKVHAAMQGWNNSGAFAHLSRSSATREKRRDGYKAYKLTYGTTFIESA